MDQELECSFFQSVFCWNPFCDDEISNYYNADGQSATPPKDGEEGREFDDFEDEDAERLVNEYDFVDDGEDEDDLQHLDQMYSNTESNKRIENALPNSPIKIEFTNISYQTTQEQFHSFIGRSGLKMENCQFDLLDGGRKHKGRCVVTVATKDEAYILVGYSGKRINDRPLKIQVLEHDLDYPEDTISPALPDKYFPQKQSNNSRKEFSNQNKTAIGKSKEETKSTDFRPNTGPLRNTENPKKSNGATSTNTSINQDLPAKKILNPDSSTFVSPMEANTNGKAKEHLANPDSTIILKSPPSLGGWASLPKVPKKDKTDANKTASKKKI